MDFFAFDFVMPVLRTVWTSWRGVGRVFLRPGGRPGPGREDFGAPAGQTAFGRRCRKSRRTRAGVSPSVGAGFSQGRRRSAASGRASRNWVKAARISQVQRSAASGVRILGQVQPRVCLNRRKVCSMSKRRRKACQSRSTWAAVASVPDHYSHTGLGVAPLGRRSTFRRITVPSITGSAPSWAVQAERWVSLGWSRSQARAAATP